MECKTFFATRLVILEKNVNEWIKEHPISMGSFSFKYSVIVRDDPLEHIPEYTLVLFYVPKKPVV